MAKVWGIAHWGNTQKWVYSTPKRKNGRMERLIDGEYNSINGVIIRFLGSFFLVYTYIISNFVGKLKQYLNNI